MAAERMHTRTSRDEPVPKVGTPTDQKIGRATAGEPAEVKSEDRGAEQSRYEGGRGTHQVRQAREGRAPRALPPPEPDADGKTHDKPYYQCRDEQVERVGEVREQG